MMDFDKGFLIFLLGCFLLLASFIAINGYNDRRMYAMGYIWVPTVQGHWEKK